jgi:hypothetical protein
VLHQPFGNFSAATPSSDFELVRLLGFAIWWFLCSHLTLASFLINDNDLEK